MSRGYRKFGLVMGANVESVMYLFAAWWIGSWANESYPRDFDWKLPAFLLSLILISHSWYVMLRQLIKFNKEDSQHEPPKN